MRCWTSGGMSFSISKYLLICKSGANCWFTGASGFKWRQKTSISGCRFRGFPFGCIYLLGSFPRKSFCDSRKRLLEAAITIHPPPDPECLPANGGRNPKTGEVIDVIVEKNPGGL